MVTSVVQVGLGCSPPTSSLKHGPSVPARRTPAHGPTWGTHKLGHESSGSSSPAGRRGGGAREGGAGGREGGGPSNVNLPSRASHSSTRPPPT